MSVEKIIENIESYFQVKLLKQNKELIFVVTLISFPILMRILPQTLIALFFTLVFLFFIFAHFYKYCSEIFLKENDNTATLEYSWGFVKENVEALDMQNFVKFLKTTDINFFKKYFSLNRTFFMLTLFMTGDLIVAFKNLSLSESGVYFALSFFTKFVFLAYIYIDKTYINILKENLSETARQTKVLDIFYKHFNGLASLSVVLFILYFILSKFLIEIFFGFDYMLYQTSLPFILSANLALLISLFVFRTATIVDPQRTWGILKIFIPIFFILFVFMDISYYDTVAYFVIGSSAVLSIFLYNFCIRKPAYIESTYNSLF